MALVDVMVPDIGDFKDVAVIELLVKPGDRIVAEQSLVTVESDKASMEIPSTHAGVLRELIVKLGDKLNQGTLLARLEVDAAPAQAAAAGKSAAPAQASLPLPAMPMAAPAAASTGAAANVSGPIEVLVPDIGDFAEVAVIELLVKPGDTVKVEQSLVTVESDKASMEIPSSHAGKVLAVLVQMGDKISKGSPLLLLEGSGQAAPAAVPAATATASAAAAAPAAASAAPATLTPAPSSAPMAALTAAQTASAAPSTGAAAQAVAAHEPNAGVSGLPHASPSIRKLARELGVPLAEVKGSGPKGRITEADVQGFVKNVMAGAVQTAAQRAKAPAASAAAGGSMPGLLPWPVVDFTKFGEVERKDLSRIQKISGANLHRNWVLIPHVTNHDDADITELEAFRVQLNKENEKAGIKVTMLAFLIKAAVATLRKFPQFNASLDGEQLVYKKYFHIGFAADTPNGLMVPVLKNADQKGVLQISQEMNELATKARDGKLSSAEMTGGCFSISSLGGIGGRYFTPIINAPEVAIMGVSRSNTEPRWDGAQFAPRLILPLSLSWDHRVIDGAAAARFNAHFCGILADFRRVLL